MAPGAGDARSTEASNPTCHSTFTTSSHSQTQTCEPIQQTSSYSASPATTSCIPEPIQQASFFRKREIPAHLLEFFEPAEIGLEPTPDEYVAEMVAVFREVRRVLRDDGTLWLNVGDSYAGAGYSNHKGTGGTQRKDGGKQRHLDGTGRKNKDLLGIPWLLAFALRADGWFLRSDIIWAKSNPMPESVRDRPTSAHEHVFLLSKRAAYFYDAGAIAETAESFQRQRSERGDDHGPKNRNADRPRRGVPSDNYDKPDRNARNVWTIATQPYSGAHFATMPPDLAERCIKAGTSEKGCCPHCGAPWERVTEKAPVEQTGITPKQAQYRAQGLASSKSTIGRTKAWSADEGRVETLGWQQTCHCPEHTAAPCTVLDPFGGAGTTGLVADRMNRNAVLIELNTEYRTLAQKRITADAPLLAAVS